MSDYIYGIGQELQFNKQDKYSIDNIRRNAIAEIKEKVNKNPKYLHPTNKERQEEMKKLEFIYGIDFTYWMQQNGIMKNPIYINRKNKENTIKNARCKTSKEYENKCARKAGFKDSSERIKVWKHDTGRNLPKEFNEDCPSWFGEFVSQNYVMKTFEDPIKVPNGNPGYDWICKKGEKIEHKGSCLIYRSEKSPAFGFDIGYNHIADWFILSAWDNRNSLNPLHVWIFYKNDIVRRRKFCEFEGFSITNTSERLKELEKWEVTNRLEKLKELCKSKNDEKGHTNIQEAT